MPKTPSKSALPQAITTPAPHQTYYHISCKPLGDGVVILHPRVPSTDKGEECVHTPRVCFAPTLWQCLASMTGLRFPTTAGVFDEISTETTRRKDREKGEYSNPWVYTTDAPLVLPPQDRSDFAKTGEVWALAPVEVQCVGHLDLAALIQQNILEITVDEWKPVSRIDPQWIAGYKQALRRVDGGEPNWYEVPPRGRTTRVVRGRLNPILTVID